MLLRVSNFVKNNFCGNLIMRLIQCVYPSLLNNDPSCMMLYNADDMFRLMCYVRFPTKLAF